MSASVIGRINWVLQRDGQGHRVYNIDWLVKTSDTNDGPATVFFASGLPAIGSPWVFGNDNDPWAYCSSESTAKQMIQKEASDLWIVTQKFLTFSPTFNFRCQSNPVQNPLNEPVKISGTFTKYRKIAKADKDNRPILSSSGEPIDAEVDDNRPNVSIGFNVLLLPLSTFAPMIDGVNSTPMWGLPVRTVKLSNVQYTRNVYGTCFYYYTLGYEFDINYKTFDIKAPDQGTKCLPFNRDPTTGIITSYNIPDSTAADPTLSGSHPYYKNMARFVRYTDKNGNPSSTPLNGFGQVLIDISNPVFRVGRYYPEVDFLGTLPGIPTSL